MSIQEKIKEMFERSKQKKAQKLAAAEANKYLAEEKEKLIKLYNELEKEEYSSYNQRVHESLQLEIEE